MFQTHFAVLTHNVDWAMTHRALLLSFTSRSSKSNNAIKEKADNERAKLFMAMGVFFCHVLRILSSDLNAQLKEHSSGIKESSPRSSGHSTSRIRRSTDGQVWADDEK